MSLTALQAAARAFPQKVVLYGAHISHPCNAVAIALTFKGIPFRFMEPPGSGWDAERGRYKLGYGTNAYRELMRPIMPTIPAIIAELSDGTLFKLNESSAIIEWIDDVYPQEPPLFPGNARDRALLRRVLRNHDLKLDPLVRALFVPLDLAIQNSTELSKIAVRNLEEAIVEIGNLCDGFADLSRREPYFDGSQFTAVDCTLLPTFVLIECMIAAIKKSNFDLPGRRLSTWYAKAQQHPSAEEVLSEARASASDWIRRKEIGSDAFVDGWWRPDMYRRNTKVDDEEF